MKILNKPVRISDPRQVALLILNKYFRKKHSLKNIIGEYFEEYKLSSLDRRFVYNIIKGTIRYLIRIDFCISLFSNKEIKLQNQP